MATRLKAVAPKAAEPSKPKILIFGKPGVGKTWGALDFPRCFYIDTEGGADLSHYTDKLAASGGVYLGPEQGALDFATVLEQVQALATEKHEFRTLIIDSISKLFNTEIAKEAERLGEKNAFGADKKPAVGYMRRLVSWLTRLDMNVILIAHEKAEWGKNERTGEREEIGATFDCWDKLEYELHLALHIVKAGPYPAKARIRKTRLTGFPSAEVFPWTYPDFAERYGRDVMEKAAKTETLATPEQIAEVGRLLNVVKLPDGTVDKWFTAAGVDSWAEMETGRVAKAISHLNSLIKEAA